MRGFGPRHPTHWRSKWSRYRKENRKISTPNKRHLDTNLKSRPFHKKGASKYAHTALGETLWESGRCIDALKERRRALKKRGWVLKKRWRVLKKVSFVRGTKGGPLCQKAGGWLLKRAGGFLRTLWKSSRSSTPSRRSSLCLPDPSPLRTPSGQKMGEGRAFLASPWIKRSGRAAAWQL